MDGSLRLKTVCDPPCVKRVTKSGKATTAAPPGVPTADAAPAAVRAKTPLAATANSNAAIRRGLDIVVPISIKEVPFLRRETPAVPTRLAGAPTDAPAILFCSYD